jgi:ATP-dependent exoDNAse (exonuclease V) alpha subunit
MTHLHEDFKQLPEYTTLTNGQKRFAQLFFEGKNLLLTGAAGTGKSHVLKLLFDFCTKQGVVMGKTATTGVAAFNIGGQTIHSFAGLGFGDEDIKNLIAAVGKKKKAVARISMCKVLVLDEASMLKAELLDKIDLVFKYYRFNNRPFGGVQIVFVADFLQLPPVWKKDEVKDFCFNSRSWKEAKVVTSNLTEIMRQKGDSAFAEALNKIRIGDVSGLDLIKTRIGAEFPNDGIDPIRIFCKNVDVNSYNEERLALLPGTKKVYQARDFGETYHTDYFNKNCPAPETLELKVGAQVMLLTNMNTEIGLVNGSVGKVLSFSLEGPVVQFVHGGKAIVSENEWSIKEQEAKTGGGFKYKVVATRNQIPLKLAYACSTHKSQGATLDRAVIDLNEAFAEGQAYCALSRVRSLESLSVRDFPSSKIRVNQECLDFYKALEESA